MVESLTQRFIDGGGVLPRGTDDAALDRLFEHARAQWPGVAVDDAAFLEALARYAAEADPPTLPDDAAAADLYLAIACAGADPDALMAFERVYFSGIGGALTRMGLSGAAIDDVTQAVRKRLFVDQVDGRARVVAVAGRGNLASLATVAAVRIALNEARGDRRREDRHRLVAADAWDAGLDDPELTLLQADHRAAFKSAFERAVAEIDTRGRNVLRMHLVERLSIDEIGAVFGAHRSTAARWLAQAREEVAHRTEQSLREQLDLGAAGLGSAFAAVRSRLDLSLSRLLAASSGKFEPHDRSTPPPSCGRTDPGENSA